MIIHSKIQSVTSEVLGLKDKLNQQSKAFGELENAFNEIGSQN
jgi:hypothetical protein